MDGRKHVRSHNGYTFIQMRILETRKHLSSKESDNKVNTQQFHRLSKPLNHISICTITTGSKAINHPHKPDTKRKQKQNALYKRRTDQTTIHTTQNTP